MWRERKGAREAGAKGFLARRRAVGLGGGGTRRYTSRAKHMIAWVYVREVL